MWQKICRFANLWFLSLWPSRSLRFRRKSLDVSEVLTTPLWDVKDLRIWSLSNKNLSTFHHHVNNWLTDWLKNRLKCLSCCSQLKISLSATVGRLQRLSQENHQNIKHWERHLWYLYLMYFAEGEKVILPKSLKVCIFISRLLLRRFYLQSYILSWIVLSVWRLTLSSVSRLYKHIVF